MDGGGKVVWGVGWCRKDVWIIILFDVRFLCLVVLVMFGGVFFEIVERYVVV